MSRVSARKDAEDVGYAMAELLIAIGPMAPDGTGVTIEMTPLTINGEMGWKLRAGDTHSLFHGRLADAIRCLADGLRSS